MNTLPPTVPHSIDAEEVLLSTIFAKPRVTLDLCDDAGVFVRSFYRPAHQWLFWALNQVSYNQPRIPVALVKNFLAIRDTRGRVIRKDLPGRGRLLEHLGGETFIDRIAGQVPATDPTPIIATVARLHAARMALLGHDR
jgi:replicative DNA helicase